MGIMEITKFRDQLNKYCGLDCGSSLICHIFPAVSSAPTDPRDGIPWPCPESSGSLRAGLGGASTTCIRGRHRTSGGSEGAPKPPIYGNKLKPRL